MVHSRPARPLRRTFYWILAGVGVLDNQACSSTEGCKPNVGSETSTTSVPAGVLRDVLEGDGTSRDRCRQLCQLDFEECSITFDAAALHAACGDTVESGGAGGSGGSGMAGEASGGEPSEARCQALLSVSCTATVTYYCEGRRHATWQRRAELGAATRDTDAGAWYARAAANEAGSVRSFRALARELRSSTLGRRFADRLRGAAREEIQHARVMRAEALRRGATPVKHEFRAGAERTLLEIALENAREGCVEETWAALMAHVQARRASTARARSQFARIAEDETRHAELAWDLHLALRGELDEDERAQLDAALRHFIDQLVVRATLDSCVTLVSEIGLPNAELERTLRARLASVLHARSAEA